MHPADRKTGITGDNQALISELLDWFDSWPRDAGALGDDLRMTGALHPYDHLFSPICVNRLNLKNRLVMGPMGNMSMVDEAGRYGRQRPRDTSPFSI
jgi:2-enoate reductase